MAAFSWESEVTVERQRGLEGDEGLAGADPLGESFVETLSFFFKDSRFHFDSCCTQAREAGAACFRVGVFHGRNDAAHSRSDDRLGAGAGAAGVMARLEGDVESGAA